MRTHSDALTVIENTNKATTNALADRVHELEAPLLVPEEDLALFAKHVRDGGEVLDLGCGAGRYMHRFEELGFECVGVDLSDRMLAHAKKRNPHLPFFQMSYRKINFPERCFDGVWSCCVLNHEPKSNMVKVLREVHRVMRQGAPLLNIFPYTGLSDEGFDDTFGTNQQTYFAHWWVDEFEAALTGAGFTVVEAFVRHERGSATFLALA